jgi:hypothetical protein
VALMIDRERAGREASPSAAIVDSQSVKAPSAPTRGYEAGKKVTGRKRHIAVDGRLLMVNLTTAAIRKRWPWLKHLFADGSYDRAKRWTRPPSSTFIEIAPERLRFRADRDRHRHVWMASAVQGKRRWYGGKSAACMCPAFEVRPHDRWP